METLLRIRSKQDLSYFLGVDWSKRLAPILYAEPMSRHYKSFVVTKKSGGTREIHAPQGALKKFQSRISSALSGFYKPPPGVHGFVQGRSIKSNANPHVGSAFVLNFDFLEFFPTCNFGRVRGLFVARPFLWPIEVAGLLAHICCLNGSLPQGASTSPILANMLLLGFDKDMVRFAKKNNCIYTRYADDVTLSSGQTGRLRELVQSQYSVGGKIQLSSDILSLVDKAGFTVNPGKTRVDRRSSSMRVTGIVVNDRLNVPRPILKDVRLLLHWCEKLGIDSASERYTQWISRRHKNDSHHINFYLKGMISFISDIRGRNDACVVKLKRRFNLLFSEHAFRVDFGSSAPEENVYVMDSERKGVENRKIINFLSQGTVFQISRKTLLTCAHCVGNKNEIYIPGSTPRPAFLVSKDITSDLAIMRSQHELPGAGFRLSERGPKTQKLVRIFGFPQFSPGATLATMDYAITQKYMRNGIPRYRVAGPIISGNSGGPALQGGEVVGLVTDGASSFSAGPDDQRFGLISSENILKFLKSRLRDIKKYDPQFTLNQS